MAFTVDGDAIVVRHPGYAGKMITTLRLTGTPAVITLRPGAIAAAANAKGGEAPRRWRRRSIRRRGA